MLNLSYIGFICLRRLKSLKQVNVLGPNVVSLQYWLVLHVQLSSPNFNNGVSCETYTPHRLGCCCNWFKRYISWNLCFNKQSWKGKNDLFFQKSNFSFQMLWMRSRESVKSRSESRKWLLIGGNRWWKRDFTIRGY